MMKTIHVCCTLCGQEYQAPAHLKAYQNLCPHCYSDSALREWDRIASARAQLAPGSPDTLKLSEWTHTISAFYGKCCLCLQTPMQRLSLLVTAEGLTAANCIPLCRSCDYHLHRSFERAVSRVTAQMGQEDL